MDPVSPPAPTPASPRPRVPRYQLIATTLAEMIADGTYASGALLPSEAELSATYEVSRVTIRKALEQLRTMGCAASHQGLGWVVAGRPVRHRLAQLTTIESQLRANGLTSERRVVSFGFVHAAPDVEAALGGSEVLEITRVVLADDLLALPVILDLDVSGRDPLPVAWTRAAHVRESAQHPIPPVPCGHRTTLLRPHPAEVHRS